MDFKEQPSFYSTTFIGSREDISLFFYYKNNIYVRCGCFWGTVELFKHKVILTHPEQSIHRINYFKEIEKVEKLFRK